MNKYQEKQLAALFSPIVAVFGIHKLFKIKYGGIGHILMFHRVVPQTKLLRINNHQSLEITPEHLEHTIQFFKKRGYDFISIDEAYFRLINKNSANKFVVFTFDDGYADNLEYAYPIFKKHNIPFTIYVTTNFPDNKAILWWYMLEDLLLNSTEVELDFQGKSHRFLLGTNRQKEFAFLKIKDIFNTVEEHFVIEFFESQGIDIFSKVIQLSLNWDQIATLHSDPLVTIGAHTVSHASLKKLTVNKAYNEILNSKKILEEKLGCRIDHFSYPFGSIFEAGRREFGIVEEIGFKTGTTTRMANLTVKHSEHMEALPRITINSMTNEHILELQISGFIPAIKNKFQSFVTE